MNPRLDPNFSFLDVPEGNVFDTNQGQLTSGFLNKDRCAARAEKVTRHLLRRRLSVAINISNYEVIAEDWEEGSFVGATMARTHLR
jgi:hypothetical protein